MTSENRRWGDAKPTMEIIFVDTHTERVVYAIRTGFIAYITEGKVGYVAENDGGVKSIRFPVSEHLEVRQVA